MDIWTVPKTRIMWYFGFKSNGNVITDSLSKPEILNSQFIYVFTPHSEMEFPICRYSFHKNQATTYFCEWCFQSFGHHGHAIHNFSQLLTDMTSTGRSMEVLQWRLWVVKTDCNHDKQSPGFRFHFALSILQFEGVFIETYKDTIRNSDILVINHPVMLVVYPKHY